ncbi:MAG: DNA-binding domain-containing protein [Balneolaceae bacterium]|nr:DNA-binding domain-containing protein [Balneolaceae bacterium]
MIRGIINIVRQGNSVVTPLVNIMPSISGVFDSEEDRFDANRHQVNLSISPGVRLRDTASAIPTEKVAARERMPNVGHYYDNTSETKNEQATASGAAPYFGFGAEV